jgi:hypothetical protein
MYTLASFSVNRPDGVRKKQTTKEHPLPFSAIFCHFLPFSAIFCNPLPFFYHCHILRNLPSNSHNSLNTAPITAIFFLPSGVTATQPLPHCHTATATVATATHCHNLCNIHPGLIFGEPPRWGSQKGLEQIAAGQKIHHQVELGGWWGGSGSGSGSGWVAVAVGGSGSGSEKKMTEIG